MTIEEFFIQEYGELKDENKKLKEDNQGLEDWARDAERVVQELIGALGIFVKCAENHISDNSISSFVYREDGWDILRETLKKYGLLVEKSDKSETPSQPEITQEEIAK